MNLRRLLTFIMAIVSSFGAFVGCNGNQKSYTEMFFGPELYNASYVYWEGKTVKHIIPIMSKIDLSTVESVVEKTDGATYSIDFETESYKKTVGEYRLYKIILAFSDIAFQKEKLVISEVQLTTSAGEQLTIAPNKCEIVPLAGQLNQDYININGAPLRIPKEMLNIPLEISKDTAATSDLKIKEIYLTNSDMSMYYYQHSDGSESDRFQEFLLGYENDIKTWKAMFETKRNDNSEYIQYGTSIIVKYEYDGKIFVALPAVPYTIYNPFDINYESIDLYCEKLGVQ